MNKRFNYENWYEKQNSKKADLLYEKLTTNFVGKNILKEQEDLSIQRALNYDLTKDRQLFDLTQKTVEKKLTWLGIDFGTVDGKNISNLATKFVLNHVIDIQEKGKEKELKETPSMFSDAVQLFKAILSNAAKENKELFHQFSSLSRAKAGAEVVGKQLGKDFGEFGSELGRTAKQKWSDIKGLFETAQVAVAGGTAATGAAVVAQTGASLVETGTAVAPQALTVAQKIIVGTQTTTAVVEGGGKIIFTIFKWTVIIGLLGRAAKAAYDLLDVVGIGTDKALAKVEKISGEKPKGFLSRVFGVDDEDEEAPKEEAPKEKMPRVKKKIKGL